MKSSNEINKSHHYTQNKRKNFFSHIVLIGPQDVVQTKNRYKNRKRIVGGDDMSRLIKSVAWTQTNTKEVLKLLTATNWKP